MRDKIDLGEEVIKTLVQSMGLRLFTTALNNAFINCGFENNQLRLLFEGIEKFQQVGKFERRMVINDFRLQEKINGVWIDKLGELPIVFREFNQIEKIEPELEECGCCGGFHRTNYDGDCRDDAERFYTAQ